MNTAREEGADEEEDADVYVVDRSGSSLPAAHADATVSYDAHLQTTRPFDCGARRFSGMKTGRLLQVSQGLLCPPALTHRRPRTAAIKDDLKIH